MMVSRVVSTLSHGCRPARVLPFRPRIQVQARFHVISIVEPTVSDSPFGSVLEQARSGAVRRNHVSAQLQPLELPLAFNNSH